MFQFDFEKLDAFQSALRSLDLLETVADCLPPGRSDLVDQIRRASMSIIHNLGEGAGEWMPAEKAKFYRYARRSATECAASVCAIRHRRLVWPELTEAAREEVRHLISLIVGLVQRFSSGRDDLRGGKKTA